MYAQPLIFMIASLLIDDTLYHIGASIKDLGKKLFAFSQMETSPNAILDNI